MINAAIQKASVLMIIVFIVAGVALTPGASKARRSLSIAERKILSTNGSTRATAYGMSNKIITANRKKFVVWLDHVSEIKAKEFDIKSGTWGETVLVGSGVDNHSGPALTMDSEGYLHIVYGTHHHPFHYRKTRKPYDISEWEPEKYFAEKLVDYDPAVNNGNWQWASSTGCDAQPYFRIFNPWLQQKKFDPDCEYIKKWIPELEKVENKVIHNWFKPNNPEIKKYPRPIVDHKKESAMAKKLYKGTK